MYYAGIDYSMTCPSITVGCGKDFKKCKSFFLYKPSSKKDSRKGIYNKNIFGIDQLDYTSQEERFDIISDWAMSILRRFKVTEVCIEDYAMASKGRVFHIAENTGVLKNKLYKEGIKIYTVSPMTAKKFFSTKGNATKEIMHDSFQAKTSVDISSVFDQNKDKSPTSDTVDSYAMYLYGLEHFFN